ncbi:MAG: hypothetical protein M1834_000609 [Cirrosporium novae-zelandiae]|nr:MAG: hypothetical protein M1834_000609 [Cirrosporium novae-zelandiae]
MAPHKVEFKRTEWFSTFEIRERVAQHFISQSGEGRIFLAGDAAHVHSVNGGQGLNTGVADAFGLVWRLAFALKQKGGQNVLNSYDVERRTVAEGVIDVAAKLVRSTVRTAQEYVEIIEKNAGYITGMGVSYPPSGKLVEESSYGEFEAGKRCPDLSLSPIHDKKIPLYFEFNSEADKTRLYSLIKYGKFLVLLLSGNCDEHLSIHKAAEYQSIARFWHIHPQNGAECRSQAVRKIRNCFVADWAKKDEQTAVVIRPDCYTGVPGSGERGKKRNENGSCRLKYGRLRPTSKCGMNPKNKGPLVPPRPDDIRLHCPLKDLRLGPGIRHTTRALEDAENF